MNTRIAAYVGWLLIAAATAFYFYGIADAICLSWSKVPGSEPIPYPEVLSTTIGTIQALLLANLGMVLGISITNPKSGLANSLMLNKEVQVDTPLQVKEKVQLVAVVIYVIALIACMITWGVNKFSNDSKDIVPIIAESGKMFIGVVLAYLTAVLSK
jgi:hypothetical protein